jgi:tRNA threonylcarbamoyl adenosine modification protein TsaD/ribosomal-protein-alanine acetyltransferase
MTVAIRDMRASDLDAVVAIERATFPTPWSRGIFVGELLQGVSRRWVVVSSPSGILGYAGSMQVGDESHVMNLAVRADARGTGVGAALLSDLMSDALTRGVERMTLEVRPTNAPAIALYEGAGFHAAGERPGYYSDTGEPALIMWTDDLGSQAARERMARLAERGRRALAQHAGEAASSADHERRALILAIESSCDETAAAVVCGGREVLSSVVASQIDFHARFGGVVPEIASRKHTEAIVGVVEQALAGAGVGLGDLDAIGVTYGPGLVGALVVGVAYAKGLAWATGLPLVGVNHLEGHLFANTLSDPTVEPPLVALIVSGGHTSLVHVPAWGAYTTLGSTLDDAAGEAFDKVAKLLGLGYPGGPVISRLAKRGDPTAIRFPRAMIDSGDYDFSLSGLKTAVSTYVHRERAAGREIDDATVAASFQAAVIDVQVSKAVRAAEEMGVKTFCLAGGVAANTALRDALRDALAARGIRLSVPPFELCTDNAAMIGAAANFRFVRGERLGLDAEAVPDLPLG